jgi:glycosyltransferase involved in cell wall biosynthesis
MTYEGALVSVVIPTLNEEMYIEEALLSIKNQTHKSVEIIVSDGCSRDRTVEIAKRYADSVIVKKTNIAAARNLGVKHARGEIVVFLDADSCLEPAWIERALRFFDESDTDFMFGPIKPRQGNLKARFICKLGWDIIPRFFTRLGVPQFSGVSIAARKSAFERIGGFRESMNATEDIDMGFRIRKCGKVAFNRHVKCYTSMRRFENGGYPFWVARWIVDWVNYVFTKDSSFSEYPVFR